MDKAGQQTKVTLRFPASKVAVRVTPYGSVFTYDGRAGSGRPGSPALPSLMVRVPLPPGTVAIGVQAEVGSARTVAPDGTVIAPAQPPRPVSGKPSLRHPYVGRNRPAGGIEALPAPPIVLPDPELYAAAMATPPPIARLLPNGTGSPGRQGAAPVAVVALNPMAQRPGGRVVVHEEVTLTVITTTAPGLTPRTGPQIEYLVITDNHFWQAQSIAPLDTVEGDLVAEFERLVAWKHARGLTAALVTVTDIVAGRYGDFRSTARDLPEVIRNFVKHAHGSWGTRWLLIGGRADIVPARVVDGSVLGFMHRTTEGPPLPGQSYWTGRELRINTSDIDTGFQPDYSDVLLCTDSGLAVRYGEPSSPPAGPYWNFTEETYTAPMPYSTFYLVVHGTEEQLTGPTRLLNRVNQIPTDFYYASIEGPGYGRPGRHDWDLRDNGVYGEHGRFLADADPDEISWQPQVSVGRAPVTAGVQARTFVDKVIAYEQLATPTPYFGATMVVVADNWNRNIYVAAAEDSTTRGDRYVHTTGTQHTVIQIDASEVPISYSLQVPVGEEIRPIPYDAGVTDGGRGWHHIRSLTDLTPSVITLTLGGVRSFLPVPTPILAVYSTDPDELAPELFVVDQAGPDESMMHQESLAGIARSTLRNVTIIERLYADLLDLPPEAEPGAQFLDTGNLRRLLDAGPQLVSLSGHGSQQGCCWLDPDLAAALTNGRPGFIAYANSCYTGDCYGLDWDVMSDALLSNPDGGAVAYIGSTRFSWDDPGKEMQRVFFERLGTSPTPPHLGELADSRCDFATGPGDDVGFNKWIIMSLNLLGDPEMPVWNAPPPMLRPPRYVRWPKEFHWKIEDRYGRPVPDAYVTMTVAGHTLRTRSDAHGIARLDSAPAAVPRAVVPADVIVAKAGHRPFVNRISLDLRQVPITGVEPPTVLMNRA